MCVCVCVCVYGYICVCDWVGIYMSVCMYIYIYVCVYINIYNFVCVYVYIYIYIYIVIRRQTCFVLSELFSVASQARFPKLGSKLKCQSKILPLSHEETSTNEGNLNTYVSHLFTYICLTGTKSSIHLKSLALR